MSQQNLPAAAEPEWAAYVAIDWGDRKHCWKLCPAGAESQTECGELPHTVEAVEAWMRGLARRFGGRPLAVCLEQARGALAYLLAKYPFAHLYPVHPATSARYRQTFAPSGAKSDPGDTGLLLDLLLHHRDRLRRLAPETAATRELRQLVEDRRRLVDERTRLSNQLTAGLKLYFPQVLDWVDDIDCPLGCALLERWPALEELQHAHAGTLRRFFTAHHSRSERRIRERIAAIQAAAPATTDAALLSAGTLKTRSLVALLRPLNEAIGAYQKKIAQALAAHPETPLFVTLPGAGAALLPRLVVAFGTQRERFGNAAELASYSGIAPVTRQSGRSSAVHFRRSAPKFLRQTFQEFAQHSLAKSAWARAYYEQQAGKGVRHQAIVRALAFKWIRILFRCWQSRVPYDESIYQEALQRRGTRLAGLLPPATRLEWQAVAGFSRPVLLKG